jgi:hypothetical protein
MRQPRARRRQREFVEGGAQKLTLALVATLEEQNQADEDQRHQQFGAAAFLVVAAGMRESLQRTNRHYFTKAALLDPKNSPWARVRGMPEVSETEQRLKRCAYLELTGFDVPTFSHILSAFTPRHEDIWCAMHGDPKGRGGRPRKLDVKSTLAMVLASFHMVANAQSLQLVFGVPPATVSNILKKGRMALDLALDDLPEARVIWLSEQGMMRSVERIKRKHPSSATVGRLMSNGEPGGVGAWTDGFCVRHERPGDKVLPLSNQLLLQGYLAHKFLMSEVPL